MKMENNMLNHYNEPIELITIKQKDKEFYIGKISFIHFENTYTSSPAEYKLISYKNYSKDDDRYNDLVIEIEDYIIKNNDNVQKGFQRGIDGERTEQIKNYILNNEFGIIPNSIIVSVDCDTIIDDDEFNLKSADNTMNKAILYKNKLYIPKTGKPFLIIDGQHRVEGCKKLPEEIKSEIELIFTFFIDIDPSVQAQLFTTINYKVKPVNKSYLYQILGEFKIETSEYTYLHELVKLMNEIPNSPLFKRVKMLGKQQDANNSLSQAFLVESLYLLISPKKRDAKSIKEKEDLIKLPVLRYQYLNKEKRKEIPKFLLLYFKAIQKIYEDKGTPWNNKDKHIMLKTIGMGALINLIPSVYILLIIKNDILEKQLELSSNITIDKIIKILKPIQEIDILTSDNNEFSKGSSRGLVNKFSKKLWSEIIKNDENYLNYQQNYIDWFNKNVVQKD